MAYAFAKVRVRALGFVARLLPAPTPFMFTGPRSSIELARLIADRGAGSVFVVTDAELIKLEVVTPVLRALEEVGLRVHVFSDVEPDPTMDIVMAGVARLRESGADAVLAVGGGSPIDAAKAMIACLANSCSPDALDGYFKVRGAVTPFFAIPTTAGTGSEVTIVAVVSDPIEKRKFAIVDNKLVPVAVALDPTLMVGLPPAVTAATGMDALTHAVESYLSTSATAATRGFSRSATRAIIRDLPRAFDDGGDLEARQSVAAASCQAGLAFTKASVGYVHAISHQIGALYHLPHGLVNAVVLPHVLEFYLDTEGGHIAELARACRLGNSGDSESMLARAFVAEVRRLNSHMKVPGYIEQISASDVVSIAERAFAEAHGTYPVPKYMARADCISLIERIAGRLSPALDASVQSS